MLLAPNMSEAFVRASKDEPQNVVCDAISDQEKNLNAFEHLMMLNRSNNQAFFINGFDHVCNNMINSIQLGNTLLNQYVLDITGLFDELNDEPERFPDGFQETCRNILASMPQVIQGINSSACKLEKHISHLSEFTGKSRVSVEPAVDVNLLVSLSCSMIQHQIPGFTKHFRLDLSGAPTVLPGCAQQISQVIHNLLMNALLSLPDRSREVVVSTSCDHDSGRIRICVRDEGIGIATEFIPHIVKPFFTTWQKHGCVGLGLTVADGIIRNLGGELSIDSEAGKGTSVLVMLPQCTPVTEGCILA